MNTFTFTDLDSHTRNSILLDYLKNEAHLYHHYYDASQERKFLDRPANPASDLTDFEDNPVLERHIIQQLIVDARLEIDFFAETVGYPETTEDFKPILERLLKKYITPDIAAFIDETCELYEVCREAAVMQVTHYRNAIQQDT